MPNATERIACIDVGTNTALLLVADLDPETGRIAPVEHRQTIVRLGQNVDERRIIRPEALDRLVACLSEYRDLCGELGVSRIVAAGTSALRDAANRDEIIDAVKSATGIEIRCISGEEEAELTFFGAVAGMNDMPNRFTVIDIGGGSTEITMGSINHIEKNISLDIGALRYTEKFFPYQPVTQEAFITAKNEINKILYKKITPFISNREYVYGVGGTITAIAKMELKLDEFEPTIIHNACLKYDRIQQILDELKTLSIEQIIKKGIPEGRAEFMTMGTLILHQFMRLLGISKIRTSTQGLRYGLIMHQFNKS